RNNRNPGIPELYRQRNRIRNTGTFHDQIGIQYLFLCMLPFFPINLKMFKNFSIFLFYHPLIGDKYFKTFLFAQDRRPYATFSPSQNNQAPHTTVPLRLQWLSPPIESRPPRIGSLFYFHGILFSDNDDVMVPLGKS